MTGRLGVLVAGGKGERFGAPKALAIFRGRTLVERAYEMLAAVCDDVVVVAPRGMDLPVPATARVEDAIEGAGPLSALVAGLEAREFTWAFALAVDLPRLERDHVERLLALAAAGTPRTIVPAPGGRVQPLAAVYGRDMVPILRAALDRGERAPTRAFAALAARVVDDAALDALGIPPGAFDDVDSREDLERMEGEATR